MMKPNKNEIDTLLPFNTLFNKRIIFSQKMGKTQILRKTTEEFKFISHISFLVENGKNKFGFVISIQLQFLNTSFVSWNFLLWCTTLIHFWLQA